ncbi:MAG: hypothetical protein SangKO_100100 [Sandaracinaceae bacterium]
MSPVSPPRVLILTSCTGEKAVSHPDGLTLDDFRAGEEHVAARHADLADHLTPARDLYTGQQHLRLLRGVRSVEEQGDLTVDLRIVSAGYGLVDADTPLAPYECTFTGMKRPELRAHAAAVGIPEQVREALAEPADLTLVLLGDDYLEACGLDDAVETAAPTVVFCGKRAATRLPALDGTHGPARVTVLTNTEAKRFSCGLVALKGELGARILEDTVGVGPSRLRDRLTTVSDPETDRLALLQREHDGLFTRGTAIIVPNPAVLPEIQVPADWKRRSAERPVKYFIPDWDDRVDPFYRFEDDEHSGGRGSYTNEAYAHQIYSGQFDPDQEVRQLNYDGLLVSRYIIDKSKAKRKAIYETGVHGYLRVPREVPVLGDCGAFGYIKKEKPPFSTEDLLEYYQDLDFTYGVSADHLVLGPDAPDRDFRYDLTIENAIAFLREHGKRGYDWTPIGAVQGWDPASYARAAKTLVDEGYGYLGLGGLVRSKTKDVLDAVHAVRQAVGPGVKLHLFGVARIDAIPILHRMELTSFDSASPLRRAWGNSYGNYWTLQGERYAAIRIPVLGRSPAAIDAVKSGRASRETLAEHEQAALDAVRDCVTGPASDGSRLRAALDAVETYEHLVSPSKASLRDKYERTLRDRPWADCPCPVCKEAGVDVVIFRGNNRNRRRGFHNTYVFYEQLDAALALDPSGDGLALHYEPQLALV